MAERARPDAALETLDALFELTTVLGRVMDQGLAERGLTTSRAEVLFRLHGHGPMVQRQLSQALQCTPRHVTALVDQLGDAGLVARAPHPRDRRATLVTLTADGAELANRIFAEREAAARRLLGDVPTSDLEATLGVLRTFLDRLEPAAEDGGNAGDRATTRR